MRRVVAFAFLLSGCGQILGVVDWVVDDASTTDSSASDVQNEGGPPVDAGVCTSPREGGMDGVLVLNEFCIDQTETPNFLYDEFLNDLATDPSVGQAPECAWNKSYAHPYPWYDASDPDIAKRPANLVDWCDAVAFCKYWGKHLCGARGDGGPLAFDAQAKVGQWYTACTNGTSQAYPYGQAFDQSKCNANIGEDASWLQPVGTPATCQGGVPGLFDMSGNAQEWENDCERTAPDAATDQCHLRGGTFFFASDSVTCDGIGGGHDNARNNASPWNVIRCCWEP